MISIKNKNVNKLILIIIIIISLLPLSAAAVENPYYYHDCTWTAWQYAHDNLGITLPSWGYADDWCYGAQRDGYPTGTTPAVNSVMVWEGHVGFVTQISADGDSVYIVEGGWDSGIDGWYHEGWYAAGGPSSSGKAFIGYVYLADVPADTTPVGFKTRGTSNTSSSEKEQELAELRTKKQELENEINIDEQEISKLQKKLDEEIQNNETRIRSIYMLGTESYAEILFSSKDIKGFIEKVAQIKSILKADNKVISDIEEQIQEIESKKQELENKKTKLEEIMI